MQHYGGQYFKCLIANVLFTVAKRQFWKRLSLGHLNIYNAYSEEEVKQEKEVESNVKKP